MPKLCGRIETVAKTFCAKAVWAYWTIAKAFCAKAVWADRDDS